MLCVRLQAADFAPQCRACAGSRPRSKAALFQAERADKRIFLTQQKEHEQSEISAGDLFSIGVEGRIVQLLPLPNDVLKVLVEIQVRSEIHSFRALERMDEVNVQLFPSIGEVSNPCSETERFKRL